ncbi:cation diffusion facilitator family transporter [Leptospira idonii]|uniref:Cation transporter n=1 Tax=Leptospira idonii TaxID=1193500 RepID=A0A4R9LZ09_9LEPT|nr:cation diffusion facilitator family transporter [Leptospira idonii]TGN19634.1 cation transporter [Leptospira idonii]
MHDHSHHSHDHKDSDHHHHHSHKTPEGTKNIAIAFCMNASFTIIELVGGLWTNSTAIVSDAFHDLGDSFALGFAYFLERKSNKGKNENLSYGYKRFSLLSAFLTSSILIVSSVALIYHSIFKFLEPEPVNDQGVFFLALFGILINGIGFMRLKSNSGWNERAVKLHFLEDVLGWVAVLVMSIVLYFKDWFWLDPLLSIGINLFVLSRALPNLFQIGKIFLQYVPQGLSLHKIEEEITSLKGVESISDSHLWSLDGEIHVFTAHISFDGLTKDEFSETKQKVKSLLNDYGIQKITLEWEEKRGK